MKYKYAPAPGDITCTIVLLPAVEMVSSLLFSAYVIDLHTSYFQSDNINEAADMVFEEVSMTREKAEDILSDAKEAAKFANGWYTIVSGN